ncbi:oligosaccharide flippase family protein [Hymenobacter sp. BT770]|uniref:lipopolysaccharide biosynthesis protein n=1 Tax=Hymenobacter sp. BT770 TaxID=2886942 RepID=UPI001D10C1F5|nr:oligosaccharide flippase family protein [Hymenobacter sp. BT770]MCC3152807.1 oligosaccharide flippase family protein [Hymenobacter sp. BT770]MDO3414882.1 oligosaccharide flippase family protein [Hymenobacter sp. BT770]
MLGKKLSQNFAISLVSMAFGILSSVFIARIGGPAILGNISLAMSFQVLIKSVFTHTVNSAHLKMYNDDPSVGMKNYLAVFVFYNVLTSLLVLAFVAWNQMSHQGTFTELQITLIIIFILQDYLMTPLYLYTTDQTSKLNIVKANMVDFYAQIVINIAKIVAVVLGQSEIGIAWYMMAACGLSSIYPLVQLLRARFGTFSFAVVKSYIRYSLSISTSTVAYGLLISFDKVLLGIFGVPAEQLGYYNVGNRLGLLVLTLGVSVGGIFLSVFSKNISENNHEKTMEQLANYEHFISIIFLPAVLVAVLFGQELITLVFGARYMQAYPVLVFSLLFAYTKTLTIPYQNYLFANNRLKEFRRTSLLFAGAIVGCTLLLAYANWFHNLPVSVAFGLLLACVFERVLFTWAAKKVDPQIRFFFYPTTLLYFMGLMVAWYVISGIVPADNYYSTYGIRAAMLLLLLPVGYLLRVYSQDDVQMVRKLLTKAAPASTPVNI